MSFDFAQTFYVDQSAVANATAIAVTSVKLFFRAKPKITGNKSGIYAPGVEIFITDTVNGIPTVDRYGVVTRLSPPYVRREYAEISTSADGSIATNFQFAQPIHVAAGMTYAVVIKFDGNEDFVLWKNHTGDKLLGTTTTSSGPTGKYVGNLYSYISPVSNDNNPTSPSSNVSTNAVIASTSSSSITPITTPDPNYLLQSWKPLTDVDLKFQVYCARYSHQGSSVSSNGDIIDDPISDIHAQYANAFYSDSGNGIIRLIGPSYPMEYITFDLKTSNDDSSLLYGDYIYQTQQYHPGGVATPVTVGVSTGNSVANCQTSYTLANGATFDFTKVFNISLNPEYIVVTSLNHNGSNLHAINVRRVIGYSTNNGIIVDEPFSFTNSAAYFYKAPVGRMYSKSKGYLFGVRKNVIILADSNANDDCRFVNNSVNSITLTANGTGYANSDYVLVTGFENVAGEVEGGYTATANVRTNAGGNLVAVYLANQGAGFVNASSIVVTVMNANGIASAGSGATFSYTVDSTLSTEYSNGAIYYKGIKVVNLEAVQMIPDIAVTNPAGSTYTIYNQTMYYAANSSNTYSGKQYHLLDDASDTLHLVSPGKLTQFDTNTTPILPSRSNQWVIRYANGGVSNSSVIGKYFSNASMYFIDITSNNDFVSTTFHPDKLNSIYRKYSINNDYTNEHTNYGNAYAKGVQSKVTFANNQFAEDLLVYLTAYKPGNTDIQVYARIHNSHDSEPFDDHDWTRLELVDGIGVKSVTGNESDMKEYTYGFQAYPNIDFTFTGGVTTSLSSNAVVGNSTTFSANLAVNDLVVIYQPLFPNNYVVGVVATITDNTHITLQEPISNAGIVGTGLKLARLKYPFQAFNNITNDNVVRYYNTSLMEYDTFDSFQLKIILLSDNEYVVPKIDDTRAIGVSS